MRVVRLFSMRPSGMSNSQMARFEARTASSSRSLASRNSSSARLRGNVGGEPGDARRIVIRVIDWEVRFRSQQIDPSGRTIRYSM